MISAPGIAKAGDSYGDGSEELYDHQVERYQKRTGAVAAPNRQVIHYI